MSKARKWIIFCSCMALVLVVVLLCVWGLKWGFTSMKIDDAFNMAIANAKAGNYDEAVKGFNEIIQEKPDDIDALFLRASAYYLTGEYSKCVEDLTEVLRLDDTFSKAYLDRAGAYDSLEMYDEAIADMDEWVNLNPGIFGGHFYRATLHYLNGDVKSATIDLEECIRIAPDSEQAKASKELVSAASLESRGLYQEAVEVYDRVLKIGPDDVTLRMVLYKRGSALKKAGRIREAIETFDKVLKLQPNYAKAKQARKEAIVLLEKAAQ